MAIWAAASAYLNRNLIFKHSKPLRWHFFGNSPSFHTISSIAIILCPVKRATLPSTPPSTTSPNCNWYPRRSRRLVWMELLSQFCYRWHLAMPVSNPCCSHNIPYTYDIYTTYFKLTADQTVSGTPGTNLFGNTQTELFTGPWQVGDRIMGVGVQYRGRMLQTHFISIPIGRAAIIVRQCSHMPAM